MMAAHPLPDSASQVTVLTDGQARQWALRAEYGTGVLVQTLSGTTQELARVAGGLTLTIAADTPHAHTGTMKPSVSTVT